MRSILTRILHGLGADVAQVEDADKALEYFGTHEVPDLALVDWHLPGTNGLELVSTLRADDRFAPMSIMMVTTECELDEISAALAAGAQRVPDQTVHAGRSGREAQSHGHRDRGRPIGNRGAGTMTQLLFTEEVVTEITSSVWRAFLSESDDIIPLAVVPSDGSLTGTVFISGQWNGLVSLTCSSLAATRAPP